MAELNQQPLFVSIPPAIPTVIFDGDCSFCRRWVERWKNLSGDRIKFFPYQTDAARFPDIPAEAFHKSVHLIEPSGKVTRGAHAACGILSLAGRSKWLLVLYEDMPRTARAAEAGYRFVAAHRNFFNRVDLLLLGKNTLPVTHHITRRWFLRLLSVIYIIAFISLWVQIEGLVGSRGILPIAPQLHGLAAGEGGTPYMQMPTIFWINASDGMLVGVCAAGVALAAMMMLRITPVFAAFGAWFCYLSLAIAGQVFLAYQWDYLLLEAGFLAIFLSPLQLLPGKKVEPAPSRIIIWLYRWLLFRLIFLAGLVKLLGGDEHWRGLSALHYHYWSQPLPTFIAWYANLLPNWFEQLSVVATLLIELVVPCFFFAPRQLRKWAFIFTVGFQLLIMATGNYGFFNLLTIVLCLLLLDDTFWPFRLMLRTDDDAPVTRFIPAPTAASTNPLGYQAITSRNADGTLAKPTPLAAILAWSRWYTVPLAAFLIFVTTVEAFHRIRYADWIPGWATVTAANVGSFRSSNGYGLFEVMTTRRPEIIVEGSDDGVNWKAYTFKWKPGDVHRAPQFCTPHMPRLDWQMWFGGLGMERDEFPRWLVQFLRRLLDGSPQVAGLMEPSPFGHHPPRLVRATVYYYQFTNRQEVAVDGAWWRRRKSSYVLGPLQLLPNGDLQPVIIR